MSAQALQQSATEAVRAGLADDISVQLTNLEQILTKIEDALDEVSEIERVVNLHLAPDSSHTVSRDRVNAVVDAIWNRFLEGNYRAQHGDDWSDAITEMRNTALGIAGHVWIEYRDALLANVDVDAVPNRDMVRIIDPSLTIPASFDTTRERLRAKVNTMFRDEWDSGQKSETHFVEHVLRDLETMVRDFMGTYIPVKEAIARLSPGVKDALEGALSSDGEPLSSLDEPDVIEWLRKNPAAKSQLVVRFKLSD
jgi:hypothetical protein